MIDTTVKGLVDVATKRLADFDTARLDAQLLMAHVLQTRRESLFAWPERILSYEQLERFETLIHKRENGEPIAYLTGKQAFWNLELIVNQAVLIPRPETELIVEWVLTQLGNRPELHVADLGTGSGAIALALAKEKPEWAITATDCSIAALDIAIRNAMSHNIKNVEFLLGSWCAALSTEAKFDAIVSNPPYIALNDPYLESATRHYEPKKALIADQQGWADLITIAQQAVQFLKPGAFLILEHGFQQGAKLRELLNALGYHDCHTIKDLAGHERTTVGQFR